MHHLLAFRTATTKLQKCGLMNTASQLLLKAKFHYTSWFGAGSELVRSWFEPDSVMEFGFEPVCDQLQTS